MKMPNSDRNSKKYATNGATLQKMGDKTANCAKPSVKGRYSQA